MTLYSMSHTLPLIALWGLVVTSSCVTKPPCVTLCVAAFSFSGAGQHSVTRR